jgi:hypothetical protein
MRPLTVVPLLLACTGQPRIMSVLDAAPVPALADAAVARAPDGAPPSFGSFPTFDAQPATVSEKVIVYAHSGSDLFSVDPESMEVTRVGPLHEALAGGKMKFLDDVTDIAIDRRGRILAVTFDRLLEMKPTGECTAIAPLPAGQSFNGLSFVRSDAGDEVLLASGVDGNVYRLDPVSGAATLVGPLGAGLASSGDLVSVAGYGTLITVQGGQSDRLARLDPLTGTATVIGDTGFSEVWGLGFWKNRVFGFTDRGEFITIDPKTGAGTLVSRVAGFPYWGAGVTTSVPVIQ